jgi:peroxiredoxin
MPLLVQNQQAPAFSSTNQHGETVSLHDFLGKQAVVLYFYPKDDTPGCTIEANDFTAMASEFNELDTVILGVSKDDCASHRAFIEKFGLNLQLLADTDGELCDSYGVWQQVEKDGVSKWKIVRSTFVINKQGVLAELWYGVNHVDHALAVLEVIKDINTKPIL